VYSVYRSLESPMEEAALPPTQRDEGSPGFGPSDRLLIGRTSATSFVDVPVGKDAGVGPIWRDSAVHYLVLAQHGALDDPPDHRDRGTAQVLEWAPATPTLGRAPIAFWDFESGPQGWTTEYGGPSPEPPDSRWELVEPSPTYWGGAHLAPGEAAGGSGQAWVTADAGGPSSAVSHDCNPNQGLVSPIWDGTGGATLLSFDYWASAGTGTFPDGLQLYVDNGSTSWQVEDWSLTTQRFHGSARFGWQRAEIDLSRVVEPSSTMRLSFSCVRGAVFSEFGIDNVRIERGTECPRSSLKLASVTVDDSSPGWGDGDGRLEPGETARLTVTLRNDGATEAATPSGFASTREAGAAVLDAHASFPSLAPGALAASLGDGFVVQAPPSPGCFGSTVFEFLFTDATGEQARGIWAAVSDDDADGVCTAIDNCPASGNPDQGDTDSDGVGDACDNCPGVANVDQANRDGDSMGDPCDNCPDTPGGGTDTDGDGFGDVCDCVPGNPAIHGAPGRVVGVRYADSSKTLLSWDAEPQATSYEVQKGLLFAGQPFEYTHGCDEGLITSVPEVDDPLYFANPGDLQYYLVVARNVCGYGDAGADSAGAPRPFLPCP
jgi:hypothetical protein